MAQRRIQDERWRTENARRLAWLSEYLRADLRERIGLQAPLAVDDLLPWLLPRVTEQRLSGDRHRLYLPATLAAPEWYAQKSAAGVKERLQAMRDPRLLPVRKEGQRFFIETYTGRYLPGDYGQWPSVYDRGRVPALALVALASKEVRRETGSSLESALLFLLCDLECGTPAWVSFGHGLTMWVYDPYIDAETLRAEYVALRRLRTRRSLAKRLQSHTRELIEFVHQMRPKRGRHRDNAPWVEVYERWSAEHPDHPYQDVDTIRRAYEQTYRRRRALQQLPGGIVVEGEEE